MNINSFLSIITQILPVFQDKVFFTSFNGLYNDNPRYISEMLHQISPRTRIFWYISERCSDEVPQYIHKVNKKNIGYYYHLNTSKVIVENGAGQYYAFVSPSQLWRYKLLKNKSQYDLATWHGTPLKKIGYDTIWDQGKCFTTTADFLIAGSEYEEKVFKSAFNNELTIIRCGNARNDILDSSEIGKRHAIRLKLGLSPKKKYVIYAPTFRESEVKKCSTNFNYLMNLDIDCLLAALTEKFDGDWEFIFRGHQMVSEQIRPEAFNKHQANIIDGNLHDDMAEYLAVCDVLITDFSGSLFDYLHTGRPCFLYAPDYDDYVHSTHGIYGNIDELPYSMSTSNEELCQAISSFDEKLFIENVEKYAALNGLIRDGKSSDRIAVILTELMKGEKL